MDQRGRMLSNQGRYFYEIAGMHGRFRILDVRDCRAGPAIRRSRSRHAPSWFPNRSAGRLQRANWVPGKGPERQLWRKC